MEQPDYDEQIKSLETAVGQLSGQLALARQKFVEATGRQLSEFFEQEARATATDQSHKTKAMGEGLAKLKAAVATLQGRAAQMAVEAIDQREYWPDYLGSPDWESTMPGYVREPYAMQHNIRQAGAAVGRLLRDHGYALGSVLSAPGTTDRWQARSGDLLPDAISHSREAAEALAECKSLAGKLARTKKELQSAREAQASSEAANLWDEA